MQKRRQCLQRHQKLVTAADYRAVFSKPSARSGQHELLALARENALPQHRLGLAIAKKHVPRAVARNLIKRLVREHFRRLEARHPALDIVILSRPALHRALTKLFERLGLEATTP